MKAQMRQEPAAVKAARERMEAWLTQSPARREAAEKAQLDRMLKMRKILILENPWYGMLAMNLKVKPELDYRRCPTAQTDGTNFTYNPAFVATLDNSKLKTLWAHEVIHCADGHPWRLGTRDLDVANQAADYVVNGLLRKDGFELIDGMLLDDRFKDGMAGFERAYAILWREKQQQPQPQAQPQPKQDEDQDDSEEEESTSGSGQSDDSDGDGSDADDDQEGSGAGDQEDDSQDSDSSGDDAEGDGDSDADGDHDSDTDADGTGGSSEGEGDDQGNGESQDGDAQEHPGAERPGSFVPAPDPEPANAPDNEPPPKTQTDWQIAAEQASRLATKAGNMPGDVKRLIETGRQETTDWREYLQQFCQRTIHSDYSLSKPNRKYIGQGLYLPGIVKEDTPRLAIAIDTSASLSARFLNLAGTHLTSILHELRPEAIDTYYIDTRVHQVQTFSPDDPEVKLDPNGGGGGTKFQPLFDYIEEHLDEREYPAALIYFTDLENYDPAPLVEPPYPVLWVTTEASDLEGQFGETIRISEYE